MNRSAGLLTRLVGRCFLKRAGSETGAPSALFIVSMRARLMREGIFMPILVLLLPLVLLLLAGFVCHRLLGALAGKEPAARYRRLRGVLILYGVLLAALAALAAWWLRELDHPVGIGVWGLACVACIMVGFGGVLFHFLRAWKAFRALPELARRQSQRATPSFFWQGVLIILPVIGAGAGQSDFAAPG